MKLKYKEGYAAACSIPFSSVYSFLYKNQSVDFRNIGNHIDNITIEDFTQRIQRIS